MTKDDIAIQFVKGVGPNLGKLLMKKQVFTVSDFLYMFPRTYEDRRHLPEISELSGGETESFIGKIKSIQDQRTRQNKTITKAVVSDSSGTIICIWFNQPYLSKYLKIGIPYLFKAKLERTSFEPMITAQIIEHEPATDFRKEIVPVYPLSAGLYQSTLRKVARKVIEYVVKVKDPIPSSILKGLELLPISDSLVNMHFPTSLDLYERARKRIVFDEFFYFQLSLSLNRNQYKKRNGEPLKTSGSVLDSYIQKLPYSLTGDQKKSVEDIQKDVTGPNKMNRLLQGDVGSGKTDVAIVALLMAIESNRKGVLLAPTDILAEQHFLKISRRLESMEIPVYLLRGKTRKKERKVIEDALIGEEPLILIGTHAVIQDPIKMTKLGMAIIDEQHRFGVMQRMALSKKDEFCHCLYMTATPIPRSLLLSCFGDLDKSIISEMPPGRVPSKTYFLRESKLEQVYKFCLNQIEKGRQVFVVYPLVEDSEKLDLKSATEGFEQLSTLFSMAKVGLIHGKMKQIEKSEIMQRFKKNDIQILVSTTVIEVGIDVPNSTIMIIRHAERFGLSQLHQLRGRIGRGGNESHCFLIAEPKSENANLRIKAMLDTNDGFKLAEVDMKIRGPGDILGTRQSGLPEFKVASLINDEHLLKTAKEAVSSIFKDDPKLQKSENAVLKTSLNQKYHLILSNLS